MESSSWREGIGRFQTDVIHVRFPRDKCSDCKAKSLCTRSKGNFRSLCFRTKASHEALQETRKKQNSKEWKEEYSKRAGIEGTLSQGLCSLGLRQSRYIGLGKTHLQNILTAAAINIIRTDNWLSGKPTAKTRVSPFKALQLKAA